MVAFSRITILDRMKPRQSLKHPSFSPMSFCAALLSLPNPFLRSRAFPSLRPRRSQQHAQLHHLHGFSGLQRPTFTLALHTIRDFRVNSNSLVDPPHTTRSFMLELPRSCVRS
ncbi:hypothetical protein BJY00DRAFT_103135 [Aspergillus carlsbadensis]|nr:hypothetical protein BJY00DRAFT_103135 [Aspergillus carlsbadensis]